jgi:hypothetical protein
MIKSCALWFLKALILVILDLVTLICSPLICLFVIKAEESEITGFSSLFPGKPREFLIPALRLFQSSDAPLDEWWYGDYQSTLKSKFDQAYYDTHWWLRYTCRVIWLTRNPAYGFGTALGYNAEGLAVTYARDEDSKWSTGIGNSSFWKFVNSRNELGWCYRAQVYFWRTRCLELYLGYKINGDTVKGNKLVAMQFSPFKKYPK